MSAHSAEKEARQRQLEDWLTDNGWSGAYDLSCALADAGFGNVASAKAEALREAAGGAA